MFQDGPIEGVVLHVLKRFRDERGWLVELFRDDELGATNRPVMAYVSMTLPGVARGPHEHREQADRFGFLGPRVPGHEDEISEVDDCADLR